MCCVLSGPYTTATSLDVPAIPGTSGLHPDVTTKDSNPKTSIKQNASMLSKSKPTVSSRTTTLLPHAVSPNKSSNMALLSSSQSTSGLTAKNPYVLNKKESLSVASVKAIPNKSELKWSKPRATNSLLSTDDNKSHSDSELYTKKSSSPRVGQPSSMSFTKRKSPALIHQKAPPTSNVRETFKWSKPSVSNNPVEKKSAKKLKAARSKLKWTNPGIQAQAGNERQGNPYVLKKGNFAGRNTTQKQGIASSKTVTRHKLTKKAVYSAPNQVGVVNVLTNKINYF